MDSRFDKMKIQAEEPADRSGEIPGSHPEGMEIPEGAADLPGRGGARSRPEPSAGAEGEAGSGKSSESVLTNGHHL